MLKRDEISDPNSTWSRTAEDEPVFIICGRDRLATDAVAAWIRLAENAGVNQEKIEAATIFLGELIIWQNRNTTKTPD